MSDLGSFAAAKTDIDDKVTTNGANENTGARVNDCLNNIVDTVEGRLNANVSFGIPMTFSTATVGAPAEGVFRFDNATVGDITNGFFHMTAPTGVDNANLWSLNNPQRGYVQVTHSGGVLVMQFTGEGANNGGVYEAGMDHVSGPLPANNAPCRVVYLPGERTGVLEYVAVVAGGEGATAPIVSGIGYVLKDDFTGITFGRANAGEYTITKVGAFPLNKVWGGSGTTTQSRQWTISRASDDVLNLFVFEAGSLAELPDDDTAHITFKTYP